MLEQIMSSIMGSLKDDEDGVIRFVSIMRSMQDDVVKSVSSDVIVIDMAQIASPVQPFMEIISALKPADEVVDKHAYCLQADNLKQFFKTGSSGERMDKIYFEEIFYEKIRYKRTITELIKELTTGKYLILNAQFLSEDSVDILRELEKSKLKSKFVFCFDLTNFETESRKVSDYFTEISMRKNYFDIISNDPKDLSKTSVSQLKDEAEGEEAEEEGEGKGAAAEDEEDELILFGKKLNFDALVNAIHNNRVFLDIDNGKRLCAWVEKNIAKFPFSTFQMRSLYLEMGIMYYYAHMIDEAALYLNYVMEIPFDDETELKALIYISEVFLQKKMGQTAAKYSKLARQKLQTNKNSPYYAISALLDYSISERSTNVTSIEKYNDTLTQLQKHGFMNSYTNVVLIIPWSFVNDPKLREVIRPKIDTAYEIATKTDNQFCLSTVCHWKGIMASFDGKSDEALEWFNKCDQLRVQIGDLDSIIKIRNGLSYEYLVRAEYQKSYMFINDFIAQIEKLSEYTEVILTLKNMAHALVYGHSYDKAYAVLKKMVQFIHIFGLENISYNSFFPEYNDILLYRTLIDLSNEDYILAKINLHNITNNERPITPVEKSILYLVQAIFFAKEGDNAKGCETFEAGLKYFREVEQGQEHRIVFMCYEFALALMKFNDEANANKYFQMGHKLAEEKNLQYYIAPKNVGEYLIHLISREDFPPINIDLDVLAEKAEKDRLVNQFHERLHDYQFLNKIMIYGTEATNLQSYIKTVMQSVFDYAMANSIFVAEKVDGQWKTVFSMTMSEFPAPIPSVWEKFVSKSKKSDLGQLVLDKKRNLFFCNMSRFDFVGGVIISPEETNPLTVNSINILNIALSNIQAQMVMFKQNEHLLYISSTDQLSLLKNRRALQDQLAIEKDRLSRYKAKNKTDYQETIAFLDLDNFKFYNDTYGHEVGDILISSFAALLTKTFRKLDFISRFGGDEFVCILTETSCDQGRAIANRLYKALDAEEHFIPKIEAYLKHKIEVPDNRHLSFSMGLCSNIDIEDRSAIDTVMANADKALYYSKQHGKSSVSLWREVKDKISTDVKSRFEDGIR